MGCWNIQGLFEKVNGVKICKLDDEEFQNTLKKFDILCLQETHCSATEILPQFEAFRSIPHCRSKSANNSFFGGFLVFIRKSIEKGIKIGNAKDVDVLEIILQKKYFNLRQDVKVLFTYASPLNSCYTKSRTMNILDKIETNLVDGGKNYIIMGDLNGRTKLGPDFVSDDTDKHSPINVPFYIKDISIGRQNTDCHQIDEQGKRILELCKCISARILNGRMSGDKRGNFTRYPLNPKENPSVIDYGLCSTPLLGTIESFSILPFKGISDHCCISLKVQVNYNLEDLKTPNMTHEETKENVHTD